MLVRDLVCQTCRKSFKQTLKRENGTIAKYCSTNCFPKNQKEKVICVTCGKEYEVIGSRKEKTRYCSKECMYGDKNEGKHPYSTKEWKEAKEKVLKRDGNTCQLCGKSGEEESLHINHIMPYRLIRSHISLNLVTLCSSCHAKTDWKVRDLLNLHPMRIRFLEMLTEMWLTNLRKSNDYAQDKDPFSNFRRVENLGLTPLQGILVRMGDKMSRLEELSKKENMVEGETMHDTFLDIAVYSIIAAYAYEQQHPEIFKK